MFRSALRSLVARYHPETHVFVSEQGQFFIYSHGEKALVEVDASGHRVEGGQTRSHGH